MPDEMPKPSFGQRPERRLIHSAEGARQPAADESVGRTCGATHLTVVGGDSLSIHRVP